MHSFEKVLSVSKEDTDDVRAFELYFERLELAGLGNIKRPDLLIFKILKKGL
jgi:hypothetical protein